jgi:hypothetical protein
MLLNANKYVLLLDRPTFVPPQLSIECAILCNTSGKISRFCTRAASAIRVRKMNLYRVMVNQRGQWMFADFQESEFVILK